MWNRIKLKNDNDLRKDNMKKERFVPRFTRSCDMCSDSKIQRSLLNREPWNNDKLWNCMSKVNNFFIYYHYSYFCEKLSRNVLKIPNIGVKFSNPVFDWGRLIWQMIFTMRYLIFLLWLRRVNQYGLQQARIKKSI